MCRLNRCTKSKSKSLRHPRKTQVMVIGEPVKARPSRSRNLQETERCQKRMRERYSLRRAEVCETVQDLGGCDSPGEGEEEERCQHQRGHGGWCSAAKCIAIACDGRRDRCSVPCTLNVVRAVSARCTRCRRGARTLHGRGVPSALNMKQSVWHAKSHHVMCSTCWKNSCFEGTTPLRKLDRFAVSLKAIAGAMSS